MGAEHYDVAVIGGGIVGLATAEALSREDGLAVVLLEAEGRLAAHQTGHNSGVIHAGLYYRPGSHKAENCALGRAALYRFCAEQSIPHDRCGKIVVATSEAELPALDELERRGRANGLQGLRRLAGDEIREYEPAAAGIAGLLVPDTGIVDYTSVAATLGDLIVARGSALRLGTRLMACHRDPAHLILATSTGEVRARFLIGCAGLQCDRVARLCGVDPGICIVPFRGEYYELIPERRSLVRNLIYPVPDPALPFLGVHFTRMIGGGVEAGPNAVFAFKREGYTKMSFSARDAWESFTYDGFWKMAARFWRTGLGEYHRSYSQAAFVRALQKLIPDIRPADVRRGGAGVRAQALDPTGKLLDDFHIVEVDRMVHVLNAPSPAATACLSIGSQVAATAKAHFGLAH